MGKNFTSLFSKEALNLHQFHLQVWSESNLLSLGAGASTAAVSSGKPVEEKKEKEKEKPKDEVVAEDVDMGGLFGDEGYWVSTWLKWMKLLFLD